jgi:flagellar basal body-associated protein FliL
MADQAAAKDAAAAPGPEKPGKGGGLGGPLAAGVVLLALGGGLGMYVNSLFTGVQKGGAAAHEAAAPGDAHQDAHKGLMHTQEVSMPDLMSNVRNQLGRRYIKVACSFWVADDDIDKVGLGAGGGHGGGTGGSDVKRIVQMALEEHLKRYDLEELTGPNIYLQLKKGFKEQIEKVLHDSFPAIPADHDIVQRVVLTNLLVQ